MILKRVHLINWLKKVNVIDSNIKSWKKSLKMSVKKIPNASKFIVTEEFNKK